MAISLKCSAYFSGLNETTCNSNSNTPSWFCKSSTSLDSKTSTSTKFPPLSSDIFGKPIIVLDQKGSRNRSSKHENKFSGKNVTPCVSRIQRWWEKNAKPNTVKINSAQELVYSLQNAGDRLVIIDFFKPGCGGCRALHPKMCQIAEENPNAIFLEVNYEDLSQMCQCLHISVLPFFRFYRGAEGQLCSFSCTNATIKKFKDALAKHGGDRDSSLNGHAKGLNEIELMRLVSAGELPSSKDETIEENLMIMRSIELSGLLNTSDNNWIRLEKEPALL